MVKLNKENNTEVKYTYPYSTHPFYTDGQKVTMTYNGPSAFKNQKVNVYLVNGSSVSSVKKAIVLAGNESINLGQIFGEGTDNSYIKLCATLDKCGDLSKPITFYSLKPGSYGIIVTLADDKYKENTSMLNIICFCIIWKTKFLYKIEKVWRVLYFKYSSVSNNNNNNYI